MSLQERFDAIDAIVSQTCEASGRARDEVRVIGVSKTVGLDAVKQAIDAGVHDFGENRPEELARKHDAFPQERWHFIGNIQSRQLAHVVGRACLIHSLCQASHADKIDRLAREAGLVQDVLIEVNDGESNKQGVPPDQALDLLLHCLSLEHVRVVGLMTMAPQGSLETARETFAALRVLRDELVNSVMERGCEGVQLRELSMGMSDDYPSAIPEGATMVRIGRALFSDTYAE